LLYYCTDLNEVRQTPRTLKRRSTNSNLQLALPSEMSKIIPVYKTMGKQAQIQTISLSEIESLIERAEDGRLGAADAALVINLSRLVLGLLRVIDDKKATIARLRKLLFGPKSEKRKVNQKQEKPSAADDQTSELSCRAKERDEERNESARLSSAAGDDKEADAESVEKKKRPGHGRLSADDFPGAKVVLCPNKRLKSGDGCPNEGCKGCLRDTNEPQVLIKREARPVIDAVRYERQVLRCTRCERRFTAELPEGITEEKYDVTADVMIAIMHYRGAMPFYRLEQLQSMMGVPLPASTQFERAESAADAAHPIFLELERQAAKSRLLHTDDTGVRILSLIKENKELSEEERRGMHTTGIGARSTEFDIVLYRSGRKHSGENLSELLKKRGDDLTEPILMADAENKNWIGDYKAMLAKCLSHARRQFVDCEPAFPNECGHVIDELGKVYFIDSQTKDMTDAQRLAYHQEHSKPIMDELKNWIDEMLDKRMAEPVSSLGAALKYMRRHWPELTQFLRVEGCPLDNNFIERGLRRAVMLRKNSLFFKTEHGAAINDVLASVIETCVLNGVNPFDYLTAIVKNKKEVRAHPQFWLPWNYQKAKEAA